MGAPPASHKHRGTAAVTVGLPENLAAFGLQRPLCGVVRVRPPLLASRRSLTGSTLAPGPHATYTMRCGVGKVLVGSAVAPSPPAISFASIIQSKRTVIPA
jgi:hypothetical protein